MTEGGNFVYTIQAANTGANDATDVIVTDVLPNQVGYVSATATSGSCTRQQSTVTCNLGTVDAGVTATVTIAVKATKSGTASNTAALSTTVTDANAANDQETETTVINKKAKGPGKGKKAKPSCAAPTIAGTAGADVLTGTRRADVIRAFAGNDRVYSLGGKDLVCADRGADIVNAGDGADTVIGEVAAATSWSEPKEATCSRGRRARIVCSAATGTTSSRGPRRPRQVQGERRRRPQLPLERQGRSSSRAPVASRRRRPRFKTCARLRACATVIRVPSRAAEGPGPRKSQQPTEIPGSRSGATAGIDGG